MQQQELANYLGVHKSQISRWKKAGCPVEHGIAAVKEWRDKQTWNSPSDDTVPPEGVVYFIRSGDFMKIGWTKNLQLRMGSLQTGNPNPLTLIGWTDGDQRLERHLHKQFDSLRLKGGEWFRYEGELIEYVEASLLKTDRLDYIDTNWLDHIDRKIHAALETPLCEASTTAAQKVRND